LKEGGRGAGREGGVGDGGERERNSPGFLLRFFPKKKSLFSHAHLQAAIWIRSGGFRV
jgi:hypothetical protein